MFKSIGYTILSSVLQIWKLFENIIYSLDSFQNEEVGEWIKLRKLDKLKQDNGQT
jgi:hypothetical protein